MLRTNLLFGLTAVISCCAGQAQTVAVPNGGFESTGGWELLKQRGAEGTMAPDRPACSGNQSLKLTKTNAPGLLILRSTEPLALQPKVRYRCRFRFHAENGTLANLLLLRVGPKDYHLGYNSIDHSAGWMSQSLLINSPVGQWEKRVVHYEAPPGENTYLHILLWGNPCSVWLDDVEVTSEPFRITGAKTQFQNACTPEQLPAVLQARPEASAQTRVLDGRTTLLLNGKPTAPVIYKSEPYTTEGDFLRFGEAGVKLATVSVRLGNIRGFPGVWSGPGKYDFAPVEAALQKALLRNPNLNVILDIGFYPYTNWGTEHPEECWTDAQGRKAYGMWGNLEGFTDDLSKVPPHSRGDYWLYPSYQSEVWQREAGEAAAALIAHLRQSPYGRTIVGYYITGGHDGQFQVLGDYDYSPATERLFRQWLQRKYGTVENLRQAWGQAPASFEEIRVPPPLQKSGNLEAAPPYVTLSPDLDYREFAEQESWHLRDIFASVAKQAAGKPVVTIAYGNPAVYDFWPLMATKSLDGAASMSYYPYRNAGYALGYKPYDTFPLYGKLFLQEVDTRSWVGSVHADEVYEMWIGAGMNPAQWRAINRKLTGVSLAESKGFWYYDMNHFFDAPEIMAEIGRTATVAERLWQRPPSRFRPDVCVVHIPGYDKFLGPTFSSLKSSHFYQMMALEQSGVPYDLHYLPDILARPELQRYKVYAFIQTRFITTAQREEIRRKLQSGGRTLVFLHDAGYLSEKGKSVEAQSGLIGIDIRTREQYARQTPLLDPQGPFGNQAAPVLGLNEMLLTIMIPEGQSSFGAREQPFWIEDPEATVLAHFAETGQVAGALKRPRGWTSVYLAGANSLTGDLLNTLARQAGAYVCGPPGQSINLSGNFVSLHGLRNGAYPLRLPAGAKQALDADTRKPLPVKDGVVTLDLQAQQSVWLELR